MRIVPLRHGYQQRHGEAAVAIRTRAEVFAQRREEIGEGRQSRQFRPEVQSRVVSPQQIGHDTHEQRGHILVQVHGVAQIHQYQSAESQTGRQSLRQIGQDQRQAQHRHDTVLIFHLQSDVALALRIHMHQRQKEPVLGHGRLTPVAIKTDVFLVQPRSRVGA